MTRLSLDKDRIKILLLEGIHPAAVQTLRQAGYSNIEALPTALEGEELKARIRDVHFIGMFDRHQPDDSGMILPNAVLDEIRRML